MGSNSNAAGALSIAIGTETKATGSSAIAIGPAALANSGGVGVGRQSAAVGDYSLAFGNVSYAQGKAAIALGHSAYASGYRSIAIGGADTDKVGVKYDANSQTQASGLLAIAFGAGARASGNNSLALGGAAIATGDNSVALGASANANAANSVAMGSGAQTTTAASAATAGAGTVTNATVGSTKFVGFAGASPAGVISVGAVGSERRIQNVASGQVSAASTDAINGSQLHATDQVLDQVSTIAKTGWNISAQGSNGSNIAPGATVNLKSNDGNVIVSKTTTSNDVGFDLAKNVKVDSVTTGNSKLSATGLVITGGPSMTAGGIDGGGKQVHNITGGNAPTDAASVGQVKALGDTGLSFTGNDATAGKVQRKFGEALTIDGGASTAGSYVGNNLKTVSDPKTGAIHLQMADAPKFGNITVNDSGSGRISGVSAGIGSTDAVNKQQLDAVGTSASAGWNISAQGKHASKVAPGQTVDLKNGDGNIMVSKAEGSNTIDFNLAKELKIDSVAMGDTRLDAHGLTIHSGPSVTAAGIDGGGKKIRNVSVGTEDSDVVNLSQLKAVSSSVAQTNERAIKYNWNDDNGNGKVDPGEIDFSTATLVGTTSTDGGVSGGTKIANLSQGEVSATSTDAINGAQLHAIAGPNDAKYITSNGRGVRYARINDAGSTAGDAHAKGTGSTALGYEATAESTNAMALGKGSFAGHENSVALGADSATTAGPQKNYEGAFTHGSNSTGQVHVGNRTIGGTADGVAADDAVNVRQLKNGVNHAISESNRYTDSRVSAVSNIVESVDKRTTAVEGSVTQITKGGAGLFQVSQDNTSAPTVTGLNSVAGGAGATASGNDSTAIGNGSLASGKRASALGNGAKASAAGSVAIGAGSVADRADTVSIGTAGQERKIANVAAGAADTDAVNVSQLKGVSNGSVQYDKNADGTVNHRSVTLNQGQKEAATIRNVADGAAPTDAANIGQLSDGLSKTLTQANAYADRQVQEIKGDLSNMNHDIRGGVASAMAMAGLPQAYLPGKSMAAIAASSYRGESGIAIGVSTITESGRYVYKLQSSGNTTGDWGVTAGAGIQW